MKKEDGKIDIHSPLYAQAVRLIELERQAWWAVAARSALVSGRAALNATRDDAKKLLFARFWLTRPRIGSSGRLDSGESILLHVLASPDSGAMHDHPWNFTSTILAGGYRERLPNSEWQQKYEDTLTPDYFVIPPEIRGPFTTELKKYVVGDTIHHDATDIHSIAEVDDGTWTLVRTGRKKRVWGFFPPGELWVPYDKYIGPDDTMVMA